MSYALVTGASGGLGEKLAQLFARDQIPLVLVARRYDRLLKIKEELETNYGVDIHCLNKDLTLSGSADEIVQYLADHSLKVSYLVNNAGVGMTGNYQDMTLDKILSLIKLNITTVAELTHKLLPQITESQGKILNIGSTAGFQPGPNMTVYFASKAFVNSFTEALAHELRGSGVSVTLSCPGPTETDFFQAANALQNLAFRYASMDVYEVAQQAYRAMKGGQRLVIHGMQNKLCVQMLRFLPRSVILKLVAKINGA